jgi:D-beta-D-heptose 7-phosphate kinase/D-beta-D-heptose 1-phosphate adenosyltransferase
LNVITSHTHLAGRLSRATVLVVGDLMLDRYYWGDVRRISPEAPVPVVKVNEKTYRLGGAGNVAANLSGLGCSAAVIGLIGDDAASGQIKDLLASLTIRNHCLTDAARLTITKTRIMASKQQVVRLDEEDGSNIGPGAQGRILDALEAMLASTDAVVLSDYGKGMFESTAFVQAIIRACRTMKRPVFIDPKGRAWERYAGATCITPNTAELELVAGAALKEDDQLNPAARDIRRQLSLDWLLVTRGPEGMSLFGDREAPVKISARAREVFDVSGAGDTVIGTLAACVGAGMPFPEAASVANTAAGIVVGKLGTERIRLPELEQALTDAAQQRPSSTLWKVADVAEASERVMHWRQAGQRIVFTNGCFDLLHPGHVSLLHQARHLGDRLIVGLNTDASIRRLKGELRPILPQQDRAAILSALEDVDMVVFFDEDTPLNLIDQLKPDILVKGADYRIEDVVGKSIVEAYGGQVRLVDILKGHSTTAIARKLSATGNTKTE